MHSQYPLLHLHNFQNSLLQYRSDRKVIHKEATIKMLRVLSGDKNVDDTEEILKALDIAEEDEISMCEVFDQYTRRGISQGIPQGVTFDPLSYTV